MAILHNLSNIADNLSGFDPVEGITDGTTVGRSWLVWKLFEGLTAFFPNLVKITNSAPTPTFLQGDVGANLQTEPALNRSSSSDFIRFYDTNDPGLTLSPPRAIIYEWKVNSSGTVGMNLIDMKLLYHISGSALFNPFGTFSFAQNTTDSRYSIYNPNFPTTTTTMINVPKVIFWKSSNYYGFLPISKINGVTAGGFFMLPLSRTLQGYKHNVGAITNDGLNIHFTMLLTGLGMQYIEGSELEYATNTSSQTALTNISLLSSMGRPPTGLFIFNSLQNVIGGFLRIGYVNSTKIKILTEPIEGVLLCDGTAVNSSAGTIAQYSNKYYYHWYNYSDGFVNYRALIELGPVP